MRRLICALATLSASSAYAQTAFPSDVVQSRVHDAIMARADLEPSEQREWSDAFDASLNLWLRFRDAECEPRLAAYRTGKLAAAAASACRRQFDDTIASDLAFRFDLSPAGSARADAMHPGSVAPAAGDETGPCDAPPPGDCDYCGINACWEHRLKADDAALNRAWRAAVADIGRRRALLPGQRAEWTALLRVSQRAWLAWRDATCDVERWETPNRFAHSIYSGVVAPCVDAETRARARALNAIAKAPPGAR